MSETLEQLELQALELEQEQLEVDIKIGSIKRKVDKNIGAYNTFGHKNVGLECWLINGFHERDFFEAQAKQRRLDLRKKILLRKLKAVAPTERYKEIVRAIMPDSPEGISLLLSSGNKFTASSEPIQEGEGKG